MISEGLPTVHEIDRNQALISAFTDDQPARPRLYPTSKDSEAVRVYKDAPYITISPASVWFTKQYPGDKWADLIRAIPKDYPPIVDDDERRTDLRGPAPGEIQRDLPACHFHSPSAATGRSVPLANPTRACFGARGASRRVRRGAARG